MLTRRHKGHHKHQRGQSFFIIVVIMAVFLLGVLGLATDYTQIWAHRQMVQGAADAACQAGAADLYLNYANPSAATTYSLDFSWIGSDYDCSQSGPGGNTGRYTGSPPCRYAMTNGYSGSNVAVTFPSSVPGAPNLGGFGTIAHPYIKVAITDPVGLSFANILERIGHVNTGASAACGLAPVAVPVPLAVLHQTASGSLNRNGGATITIFGGPNRAVQVDSSSSTAVLPTSGGSGLIDLRNAGPAGTGADFGLFGQEAQPSSVKLGVGTWISPAVPYGDPWTTVSAPTEPAAAGLTTAVGFTYHGCPDPSGCAEFAGGDYTACTLGSAITSGQTACMVFPFGNGSGKVKFAAFGNRQPSTAYILGQVVLPTSTNPLSNPGNYYFQATVATGSRTTSGTANTGIIWPQTVGNPLIDNNVTWTNVGKALSTAPNTAIFAPGLFYIGANGLNLGSGSTVRMSTATGDSNSGAILYFSSAGNTVAVDANSGKSSACTAAVAGAGTPNGCIVTYKINGTNSSVATGSVPMRALQCPGGAITPTQVPATLDGNILFGPCTGTYGSSDGANRGFLFFQSHSNFATPSWGGGGQFLLSGFMYFHSSTTGTTCGTNTTCLTMSGGSGAGAYTLGNIVVDQVNITGNSGISMILNPASTFQILRPQLLR